MGKGLFTFAITLICGVVCMAIGYEFLNGFSEFGTICAISIAAGVIVYFNEKKQK